MSSKIIALLSVTLFAVGLGATMPSRAAATSECRADCEQLLHDCMDALGRQSQCVPPYNACVRKCLH